MTVAETRPSADLPDLPGARSPEPEPWRTSRTTRPPSEYWDVANARWTSKPAIPGPRLGD